MGDNLFLNQFRVNDYATSVKNVLVHMDKYFASIKGGGNPGVREDQNEQIIEEIIFRQQRGRNGNYKSLSSLQELQLLEMLIQYFSTCGKDEWTANAIYHVLFGCMPFPLYRQELLQKFLSMAIAVGCNTVLNAAASWMQVQNCGSDIVMSIIQGVAEDYCMLSAGAGDADEQSCVLASLPELSPHFTCNFITSITHIYQPIEMRSKPAIPSVLLRLLTDWVSERPQLCLYSLYNPSSSSSGPQARPLWTSPSKHNTQTPIPGLVLWCTSAPLLVSGGKSRENGVENGGKGASSDFNSKDESAWETEVAMDTDTTTSDGINTNSSSTTTTKMDTTMTNGGTMNGTTTTTTDLATTSLLWSKLHMALLECVVSFASIPGAIQLELMTLGDMMRIVRTVVALLGDSRVSASASAAGRETAIYRLVQVLQVSLSNGAFRCSLADLKNIVASIPDNRLLQAVAQQHLSVVPPKMHNVQT